MHEPCLIAHSTAVEFTVGFVAASAHLRRAQHRRARQKDAGQSRGTWLWFASFACALTIRYSSHQTAAGQRCASHSQTLRSESERVMHPALHPGIEYEVM